MEGSPFADASSSADPLAHVPLPYSADDFRREITRAKRKRRIVAVLVAVLALIVALAIVAVVVFKMPGSLYTASDGSMAPVIEKGQVVMVEQVSAPSSDDIIAYRDSSGSVKFKRVVAVAGEWVNVASSGTVAVSSGSLEGSDVAGVTDSGTQIMASHQVPEGSCFVMTDTDGNAIEALYQTESYASYDKVIGRAAFKVWPITAIGPIA